LTTIILKTIKIINAAIYANRLKVQSVTIPTKQTEEKPSEGDHKSSVIQENLKKPTQSQQTKSESMKTAPKVFTKKSTERARQISTESSSDADSSESDST